MRGVTLNRAKDYYENKKELLRERAKNKYRELSEGEKNIKGQYGKCQISDTIICPKKKKKTKRISKNYRKAKKQMQICEQRHISKQLSQRYSFFY